LRIHSALKPEYGDAFVSAASSTAHSKKTPAEWKKGRLEEKTVDKIQQEHGTIKEEEHNENGLATLSKVMEDLTTAQISAQNAR